MPWNQATLPESQKEASIIASSVKSATSLALIQFLGRIFTFLLNQYLVRHVTPRTFGIAIVQMEFFMSTVLYISREAFRNAALRSHHDPKNARKIQEIVNLSHVPTVIGLMVAILTAVYLMLIHGTSQQTAMEWWQFKTCLGLYAVSCMVELMVEPIFVLMQISGHLHARVILEAVATMSLCLTTLVVALSDAVAVEQHKFGVAAYGIGRVASSAVLLTGYLIFIRLKRHEILPVTATSTSWYRYLMPARISSDRPPSSTISTTRSGKIVINDAPPTYLFNRNKLHIAGTLTKQNIVRHFLTEGDKFLLSLLSSAVEQGVYGFVFNYGSIVARTVYISMEETFRVAFGQMEDTTATSQGTKSPRKSHQVSQSMRLYMLCVRFHLLTGLILISMGSTYSKAFIHLLAGPRWSVDTNAPQALSLFCFLLPLIGINGISESFVASTASPNVIAQQSRYLMLFFAAFAIFGALNLRLFKLGAIGLILANMMNMGLRISWCVRYISQRGGYTIADLILQCSPTTPALFSAFIAFAVSWGVNLYFGVELWSPWLLNISCGVLTGVSLLASIFIAEKIFINDLLELYRGPKVKTT